MTMKSIIIVLLYSVLWFGVSGCGGRALTYSDNGNGVVCKRIPAPSMMYNSTWLCQSYDKRTDITCYWEYGSIRTPMSCIKGDRKE